MSGKMIDNDEGSAEFDAAITAVMLVGAAKQKDAAFAAGRAAGLREAADIADEARSDVTEVYPSNLDVIDQARGLGWQDGTTWVAAKIRARADEGER